jgi:hypothetical protein
MRAKRSNLGVVAWPTRASASSDIQRPLLAKGFLVLPGWMGVLRRFTDPDNNGLAITDPAWAAPVNRVDV